MLKEFSSLHDFLVLDAKGLAGTVLHCPECGKDHSIPIGKMKVGIGLANDVPKTAEEILGHAPEKTALIYDHSIENLVLHAFEPVKDALRIEYVPRGRSGFWLDSTDVLGDETARIVSDMHADLVIGAGSGVIADLTKWAATKAGLPFILYGTAASMNAHASVTATITRGDVKVSEWLDPASAVFMDTGIIRSAPKPMRLAGLGDLVARSICNADWLLANFIRGKDFCPVPYLLTALGEGRYLGVAQGIGSGDLDAADILAEASLVSAVSMTMMAGETSPSSGTEHVFSHFWDLQTHTDRATKNLHGVQVGIGTVLSYTVWEYMRELDVTKIDPEELLRNRPSLESILEDNKSRYGETAVLFDEAVKAKWISDEEYVPYIRNIIDRWGEMWKTLSPYIGDKAAIRHALIAAGFKLKLSMIGRTADQVLESIRYGARYRSRYTILDLAGELGVLPQAAEEIFFRSDL